ncbi:MAG: hypothetical protein C0401_12645, partial [Anaerolinea sp.]|nr:hypothetical protein [Anaerolinea sp.]
MKMTRDFWRNYSPWFGQSVVDEIERTVTETWIDSAGGRIHLDIYARPSSAAIGTVVFSHGIAGYGRMVGPFALRLWKRGFNVICPDLAGYGFNEGKRGDWIWPQFVSNLLDSLTHAHERFDGPQFLAGASLGGPLAYHAACHAPHLSALACYCLFDYRDARFLQEVSTTRALTPLLKPIIAASARFIPTIQIPTEMVVTYRHIAEDPKFVTLLRRDLCAGTRITLRAVNSMLRAVPAIEYEQFSTPTLVIQPDADRMIPPNWSRLYFDRLGCEKAFAEIPNCGHWTLFPTQLDFAVD